MSTTRKTNSLVDFPSGNVLDRSLEDLVGYNVKRSNILFQSGVRKVLEGHGLNPRSFAALCQVVAHPGISQSDVARVLGIERSGLVAIIDSLQENNCLERTTVQDDRRVQALKPTQEGIETAKRAMVDVNAKENQIMENLTSDEQITLLSLLQKLRDA